ncbi:MAG: [protein-PII] uridylyltransferase [Rhodobacteraceae bacterium]|nr:[protein-PII] uridylyltransferase [Paracoccaceae bacterium]
MRSVFDLSVGILNRNGSPPDSISVQAVGGYGRGEMAPESDVDLLFLTGDARSDEASKTIEFMLYMLWDLKLKVGHSVRSIRDCIVMAKEDLTIRTAMLECRLVWGRESLADELEQRLWKDVYSTTGPAFVEAKLEEREQRYQRHGGNRYLLEPNVKEGKGCLRDLQTLYWIMKYLYRVHDKSELLQRELFTIEEYEKFLSAESFLWAVRCELHRIAGRAQDILHFDAQPLIAESLGFAATSDRQAVENFMQEFFTHATNVGELTRIFLTKLEEQHVKRQPLVKGLLQSAVLRFGAQLPEEFKHDNGRLNIRDPETFLACPLNIIKLFETGLSTGLLIHPDAFRLIAANLHLIDQRLVEDPEAKRIFLDLLLEYGNPERALRRMNETGVLGRLIPEFRGIIALMQYNSYHHYTVDEHTIQCISVLARIERGEHHEKLASGILAKGINRRALYVALLLHDIGKGRGGDHSVIGAEIVRSIVPGLGLNDNESELVEWLVLHHLLMSDTAQKRDITDPATVKNFAETVGSRTRLRHLTILTICDIMGVGPNVWTGWKAYLIRELYNQTHLLLTEGLPNIDAINRVEDAKASFRAAMSTWTSEQLDAECERFPDYYWQGIPTSVHVTVAGILGDIDSEEGIGLDFAEDTIRGATRACFAKAETPGLFARIAGILLLVGARIIDARVYTSSDNCTVVVAWLQNAKGMAFDKGQVTRIRKQVNDYIRDPDSADAKLADPRILKQKSPIGQHGRMFAVPTEISIDNDGSEYHTIIEVDTRDRTGLLYDLARTLEDAQVVLVRAVIATYGAQAVDVFYVKDKSGMKLLAEHRRRNLARQLNNAIDRAEETGT